jgi:ATP-dependent Lon protease
VILPKRNAKDLIDVPKRARNELQLVLVDHIDQVLDVALKPSKPGNSHPRTTARKPRQKIEKQPVIEEAPVSPPV